MKKLLKTIVSLVIVATLCIAGTSMAWAEESSGDSGDFSLEDLLGLLQQLTGDDDTESGEIEDVGEITDVVEDTADLTTLSIGSFSFDIPTEWYENGSEEDDMYAYYAADSSKWVTVNYADGLTGDDQLDMSNEEQVEMITSMLAADAGDLSSSRVQICGVDTLFVEISADLGTITVSSYSLILPYNDELLMLNVSGMVDCFEDFTDIAKSFEIEGADGETDLSGIADGAAAAPAPVENPEKPASAASAAEGIDVVAEGGEVVLVDNDVMKLSIKNFSNEDSYYGMTAKVFVENKTDINLYVTFAKVSVNDYMLNPYFGTSVSAGHKSNSDFHFYKDDLEESNITDIRDIEFTVQARDDDDWSADYLVDEPFHLYPFGMDVPEQAPQEFDDDAIVMVDNDDFTMILTGFSEDDYYVHGYVYLENKTDVESEFKVSGDSTVNGYELSPYFYKDVMPGKKMCTDMTWSIKDLEENDIETIEDMELELVISDSNNWSTPSFYEDVIYVTFE